MNTKVFSILLILAISIPVMAQNYNATAFNKNGGDVEYLFPQDKDGKIRFSEIVNIKGTSDQIMEAVRTYIQEQKGIHDLELRPEVESPRKYVTKIVYPINKQYWAVELWGSPILSGLRDASRITFKCTVDVLEGKYRYILEDFWTDNRRIHGEAKDNGETNMIYAQRLNSLTKERQAFIASHQNMSRKNKEELFDKDSQINYEKSQYRNSYEAVMSFINGLKHLVIGDSITDFEQLDSIQAQGQIKEAHHEPLDLQNYHGNLLSKGNNVFIVTEGIEPYEQAGAYELMKQITIDGLWNIVPSRNQAHFVFEYRVDLKGRDHAYLTISDRDGKDVCNSLSGTRLGSSESMDDNQEVAREMYLNTLSKIPTLISKNKTPKALLVFKR